MSLRNLTRIATRYHSRPNVREVTWTGDRERIVLRIEFHNRPAIERQARISPLAPLDPFHEFDLAG